MHPVLKLSSGVIAAGVATLAYSAGYEVRAFRLREATVPCLPPRSDEIRVLHLSDVHLTPTQRRKEEWLAGLAALEPDLVINTGDNISHVDAVEPLVDALGELLDVPGVFVFGSNDYWGPVMKNPLRYFLPNGGSKRFHG